MHRQSDTDVDVTMTLLAWLVFHTLSAMTTLCHKERRFVFLLCILSFKWLMCNSQGNLSLTEPDDNFCAIGIVATTLNTIYEGFSLMPMNFVIWSFTEQTASSIFRLILTEPLLSTLTILPSQDSNWYHNSDIISSRSTLLSKLNLI